MSVRWRLHQTHPFSEALLLVRPGTAELHFLLLSWAEGPCLGSGARAENLPLLLVVGMRYKEGKVEGFFALFTLHSRQLFPHVLFINVLSGFL